MDDTGIRTLIEDWARAIAAQDLDGVLAHHDDDIVMFDVPPPEGGIRGMEAYAQSWPPFFDWIRSGARFEITELHVEHGDTSGYAWALLRCGMPEEFEKEPDRRLRVSFGLRRSEGAWRICHEHHSFTQ